MVFSCKDTNYFVCRLTINEKLLLHLSLRPKDFRAEHLAVSAKSRNFAAMAGARPPPVTLKHSVTMKHLLPLALTLSLSAMPLSSSAKGGNDKEAVYTNVCRDSRLAREAAAWAEAGEWRAGFTKASPDESVNLVEFYTQYRRNPEAWQALFRWLQETDLLAIPAGRHLIPGTTLIASVEDSENGPLAQRKSESHRFNIDFMYVVKGTEGFRLLDHKTSRANTKYKYDVLRYDYLSERCKKIESTPGRFLIMFPCDWHIAKVQTSLADQRLRVIVVKMPVAMR